MKILIVPLLFVSFVLTAQDNLRVIPPAPNTAALGLYGEYPVDMATGIPDIRVPIYTIATPRLTVPVYLSYHPVLRVRDHASWVGLGWSLNAGGVISRDVIGIADEDPYGFMNYASDIKDAGDINPGVQEDYNLLKNIFTNQVDGEPDAFQFNFLGKAGKIIFGNDGVPRAIPFQPWKIEFDLNTGVYMGSIFTITIEDGTVFIFNNQERSWVKYGVTGASEDGEDFDFVSGWYLSEIISADRSDTVTFIYNQGCETTSLAQCYPANYPWDYNYSQTYYPNPLSDCGITTGFDPVDPSTATDHFVQHLTNRQMRLEEIRFKGGKLALESSYDNRGDLDGGLKLSSIKLYEFEEEKESIYKSEASKEFYFPYYSTADQKRLKLQSLTERRTQGSALSVVNNGTYTFTYNAIEMPPSSSNAIDYYGFYNGETSNEHLVPNVTFNSPQGIVTNNGG